jgi:amidase
MRVNNMKTAFQSAGTLARSIKRGKIGSLELLNLYIDRIEKFNPSINAVVAKNYDEARARARKADAALKKGVNWGKLHGLPMTIKDLYEVVGMPCTSGSPNLKDYMPSRNADIVQSLIDQGAIIFGKTNTPLFGGDFQTYNEVYGQTNNPWNTSLSCGGSSGGSAAALAAGLTALEMGSDVGGSLRNPAHYCGVYSHKPSFGIVPCRGHVPPPPGTFAGDYFTRADIVVAGPMARSIDDIALAMGIMTGPERMDSDAWKVKLPAPAKSGLKKYRIGLWLDDPACPVDTVISDCIQTVADRLAKAGAKVEDKRPDIDFARSHEIYINLLAAVVGSSMPREIFNQWAADAKNLPSDDRSIYAQYIRGATQVYRDWLGTDVKRQNLRKKWADFFRDFDILLCPVVPAPEMHHNHSHDFFNRTIRVNGSPHPYMNTAGWAGLTGLVYLPSTVMPAGSTSDGMPIGLQVVGPYLGDSTTIQAAKLISEITGGFRQPPGFE